MVFNTIFHLSNDASRTVNLICLVYLVSLVERNQIHQKDQMNQLPATRRDMLDGKLSPFLFSLLVFLSV